MKLAEGNIFNHFSAESSSKELTSLTELVSFLFC